LKSERFDHGWIVTSEYIGPPAQVQYVGPLELIVQDGVLADVRQQSWVRVNRLLFKEANAVESGWGEATDGLSVRLHSDKVVWYLASEPPIFRLRVRNLGGEVLNIPESQELGELEVEGIWYAWSDKYFVGYKPLPPGRQIWHLAWALIPLMALAARVIAREVKWDGESGPISAGLALIITVLLAFVWFQLAGMAQAGEASQTRSFLALGVILIIGVSAALVGLGWSWPAARRGLVWGVLAGIGIYSLSASFKMVSPLNPVSQELWYGQPSVIEEQLVVDSLGDLSEWGTGRRDALDVTITQDLPSLRWVLRDFGNASFGFQVDPLSMPSALITAITEEPDQPAAYRGADFVWHSERDWGGAFPPDLLRWIVFRDSPLRNESIIFWARNDLFPGGESDAGENLPPPP
jgi:hypothetical protein